MKILLGITGSIAAFKSIILSRLFVKEGHYVKTVITKYGTEFVTPLSLGSLTQGEVYTDEEFFAKQRAPIHIELGQWADIVVVAPASADFLAKLRWGIADELIYATILASKAPIVIAPAMHESMWNSSAVQENVAVLEKRGYIVIEPHKGELSSLEEGRGRMVEPEEISMKVSEILRLKKILEGKRILIAYGRTEEDIDPVRVITNRSTGKMGKALTSTASILGGYVIAVSGETSIQPQGVDEYHKTRTSKEMKTVLEKLVKRADIFIMASAVSDLKPSRKITKKIKRERKISIEFIPTQDILKELSTKKKKGQVFVGFAMESKNILKDAKKKLVEKGVDIVVANPTDVMGRDDTQGYIIDNKNRIKSFKGITKYELSFILFQSIINNYFK